MSEMTSGTPTNASNAPLYLAFELSNVEWKLGFTPGAGQKPRERKIRAGDLKAIQHEIRLAKERFGLPANAPVRSCYEAGRDGFWLHRYLLTQGIENLVVDSASIEVNRRAKRAKTDRLDVGKLVAMLIRYYGGEKKVWSVAHIPSVEAEDERHLHRMLMTLNAQRTRQINRLEGLLVAQGVHMAVGADFLEKVKAVRLWDGSPLPPGLHARTRREYALLVFVEQQVKELEAERRAALRTSKTPSVEQVRQLMHLRGIGENSAWLYVMEFFGWRHFHNRREVGGLAGLSPTPYQSGGESREQGISKAGSSPIRLMAIEIAWSWIRLQPESALTLWYQVRFGEGSKRLRKIGIVALARKLLVALWRYLETGEIPAGAQLKA